MIREVILTGSARYDVSQMNTQINGVQKAIGMKKKVGISRPGLGRGEMLT
jgi:hypothetical protein